MTWPRPGLHEGEPMCPGSLNLVHVKQGFNVFRGYVDERFPRLIMELRPQALLDDTVRSFSVLRPAVGPLSGNGIKRISDSYYLREYRYRFTGLYIGVPASVHPDMMVIHDMRDFIEEGDIFYKLRRVNRVFLDAYPFFLRGRTLFIKHLNRYAYLAGVVHQPGDFDLYKIVNREAHLLCHIF